jgi:hypothetical protein
MGFHFSFVLCFVLYCIKRIGLQSMYKKMFVVIVVIVIVNVVIDVATLTYDTCIDVFVFVRHDTPFPSFVTKNE